MTGTALVKYRPSLPVVSAAGGVLVVWTSKPLGGGAVCGMIAPDGTPIAAIVARALMIDPELPAEFILTGLVTINGQEVPRHLWPHVRPRRRDGRKVIVVLHPGLGRGGGSTLGTIIQLAAVVAAFALTGPFGGAAALGLTATQGAVLALGITVGASLAVRALSPPPTTPAADTPLLQNSSGVATNLGRAGVSGNTLTPNAPLPRMTGPRRYAPPFGTNPYVEIDGDDEVVEAVWVWAEPTSLSAIRLGNVALEDMSDAEVQISEGKPGDNPLTLINRCTATEDVNVDISRHQAKANNGDQLDDQLRPERSLPIWHPLVGRHEPDEIVMTLTAPGGLVDLDAPPGVLAVPMRIRFRRRGDLTWTFAPEIHIASNNGRAFHKYIKLIWETPPIFLSQAPTADAPYLAFKFVPPQTVDPPRAGWQASDYFSAGTGSDVMSASTFNTHLIRNVSLNKDGVVLHLDPATFPKGVYELEVMFGVVYAQSSFSPTAYTYGGTVYDLFGYYNSAGTLKFPRGRANLRDDLTLQRCASIWHKNPLPSPEGIAFVAIRVRNRQLGELTAEAAGLVPQWNGSEWTGLSATRNPAPHFRSRLSKQYPDEIIGNPALIAWQEFCEVNGYEVCAVLRDGSFMDGLNLIASPGRARPRQSEIWDVLVDRDTSAEGPVDTFSPRNMRGLSFDAALAQQIGGFRVRYADRSQDHRENYVIVRNPNAPDLSLPLEEIVNEAQDVEEAVVARALFDLAQAEERPAFYSFDVAAIGIGLRRSDVIAVNHDILAPFSMGARIKQILTSSGNVTGLVLDGTIPQPTDQAFSNIAAAWSNYSLAFAASRFGVAIRLKDRTELKAEIVPAGEDSDEIAFVTPFAPPAGLVEGCHVVGGPLNREYQRFKLWKATYKGNLEWNLVCQDEANQIHGS